MAFTTNESVLYLNCYFSFLFANMTAKLVPKNNITKDDWI